MKKLRMPSAVVLLALVMLPGCGAGSDADPTTPAVAAETPTVHQQMARCLSDQGWKVTWHEAEDSLEFEYPNDQRAAFDSAREACLEAAGGYEPVDYATIPPEDWTRLFERSLATAECLRGEGYDVPEAPAEATFVEDYPSGEAWSPYDAVGDVSRDTWGRLNRICPQPDF